MAFYTWLQMSACISSVKYLSWLRRKQQTHKTPFPAYLLDDLRGGLDSDEVRDYFRVLFGVCQHIFVPKEYDVLRISLRSLVPLQDMVKPRAILASTQKDRNTCITLGEFGQR